MFVRHQHLSHCHGLIVTRRRAVAGHAFRDVALELRPWECCRCLSGPPRACLIFFTLVYHSNRRIIPEGQGLVVALCYRLITVLVAALGIGYYIGNRREVSEAIHEKSRIP